MNIKISAEISLSEIRLEDREILYELMSKIYPAAYAHLWKDKGKDYLKNLYSKENLKLELKDQNAKYYFIKNQELHIGILRIIFNKPINTGAYGVGTKLNRIYIDPSVQGKGIGKKIIHWMETELQEIKTSYLWLEVMDTQENAIQFYKKLGFRIVESIKFKSDLMKEEFKGMYLMKKDIKKVSK